MKKLPLLLAGLLSLACLYACTSPNQSTSDTASTQRDMAAYRARSEHWKKIDTDFIQAELAALGLDEPKKPAYTKEFGFDPKQSVEWFKTAEGQRIANILVSFQTPSGGWSKRTDMSQQPRQPGEAFGVEEHYIPTFDNAATSTQLDLLAKAYTATGKAVYADAFYKGINLILDAQYPNGGWPQNYPLVGSYHDHITYNDALMRDIMVLLDNISKGDGAFAFVSSDVKAQTTAALDKAIDCVLKTQVRQGDQLSIWGAQHDAATLQPAQARAYEMPALSTTESVAMLEFLMTRPNPSPELINAIHAAATWYEANKILGYTWKRGDNALTADADAEPMWSRFVDLETNRPVFGDRDGSVYYDIGQVSQERLDGYAWFSTAPNKVLKKYAKWAKKYPRQ